MNSARDYMLMNPTKAQMFNEFDQSSHANESRNNVSANKSTMRAGVNQSVTDPSVNKSQTDPSTHELLKHPSSDEPQMNLNITLSKIDPSANKRIMDSSLTRVNDPPMEPSEDKPNKELQCKLNASGLQNKLKNDILDQYLKNVDTINCWKPTDLVQF